MKASILFSVLVSLTIAASNSVAAPIVLSGYLNDPANSNLAGSNLGPALFADELDTANNVALYQISMASSGTATFTSKGFVAGGADPYFTLFTGTGPAATVIGSNYAIAFSTGGDFSLAFPLLAGGYTIAIGDFANMSTAENFGTGSLADGFAGLGGPFFFGNGYYNFEVSSTASPVLEPPGSVAEPPVLVLLVTTLIGTAAMWRKQQN